MIADTPAVKLRFCPPLRKFDGLLTIKRAEHMHHPVFFFFFFFFDSRRRFRDPIPIHKGIIIIIIINKIVFYYNKFDYSDFINKLNSYMFMECWNVIGIVFKPVLAWYIYTKFGG